MTFGPISAAESTARGDIPANARSFAHRLRAGNEAPNTIKAYLDAVGRVDAFFEARGMPRSVASVRPEHVESFIEDQLRRLKPASTANRSSEHGPTGFALADGSRSAQPIQPGGWTMKNPSQKSLA